MHDNETYTLSKFVLVENATRNAVVLLNKLTNKRVQLSGVDHSELMPLLNRQPLDRMVINNSRGLNKLVELGFLFREDEDEVEYFYQNNILESLSTNFLNAPAYVAENETGFLVVGVPFNANSKIKDETDLAPEVIRKYSTKFQYSTDVDGNMKGLYDSYFGKKLLTGVRIRELGNIRHVPGEGFQSIAAKVGKVVNKIMQRGSKPVVLGGNHSITYGVLHSIREKPLSLLHFDAHLDNDLYSESIGINHSNFISALYQNPSIQNIYTIGSRGYNQFVSSTVSHHHNFDIHVLKEKGLQWILEQLPEDEDYYLSVDIDVLDPSYAPGVTYPEPFGMAHAELIQLLRTIGEERSVIGFDLVEYNPANDQNSVTALLCNHIILNLMDSLK